MANRFLLSAALFASVFTASSAFAYPVTVDEAARWAQGLPDRGFQLAPASALVKK